MTVDELDAVRRFTKKELAEFLGKDTSTIDHWRRVGLRGHKLRSMQLAGRVVFFEPDVNAFLRATSGGESERTTAVEYRNTEQQGRAAASAMDRLARKGY